MSEEFVRGATPTGSDPSGSVPCGHYSGEIRPVGSADGASTKYGDIIDLPHHQSATRPQMSTHDRAGQFSPYAALTGFGKVIAATEESMNAEP